MGRARSRVAIRKQNIFKHTSDHTHTHAHAQACVCVQRERERGQYHQKFLDFVSLLVLHLLFFLTVTPALCNLFECSNSWTPAFAPGHSAHSRFISFFNLALTMWLVTGLLPYAVLLILVILLHSLPTPSALDPSTFAPFYTNARWRKIPTMSWFQLETSIAPSPVPCAAPPTFSTLLWTPVTPFLLFLWQMTF